MKNTIIISKHALIILTTIFSLSSCANQRIKCPSFSNTDIKKVARTAKFKVKREFKTRKIAAPITRYACAIY